MNNVISNPNPELGKYQQLAWNSVSPSEPDRCH